MSSVVPFPFFTKPTRTMKPRNLLFAIAAMILLPNLCAAKEPPKWSKKTAKKATNFRSACTTAQAQIDMDINNVRARLLTGGDMWWDRSDGKYVVPKPLPGQPEVSAIYAAGIWLGGLDDGGNLKVACQTYGNRNGDSDFWPGPLAEADGMTDGINCNNWDKHFEVKGAEIQSHIAKWQAMAQGQGTYSAAEIPAGVKAWPATGNPYFAAIHGFDLPDAPLADFYDHSANGIYEPLDGDFPIVNMSGCLDEVPFLPDQLVFWVYNDEGGGAIHGETNGIPIRMEIQATAFAFATNDPLNDMTFQRHKFINRASEDIDSFYFGLWMDADLGCHLDDFFGCNPSRDFAYFYNADDLDGQPESSCGDVTTYGANIPAIGVDIFRGPRNENGEELGMSSFTYSNNLNIGGPPGTGGAETDVEFYNYLTGSWQDGTPFTFNGDGYDPTDQNAYPFVFSGLPNDTNDWSMCNPVLEFPSSLFPYDRQTVQSCGPMLMQSGATNELTFGVVFAPNIDYPCPDLTRLFAADDYAQDFFDNCFTEPFDGPDAPDVDWLALDREISLILSNIAFSNNLNEQFQSPAFGCLGEAADCSYNFEGYLVYQMIGPGATVQDIGDTTKARLVRQSDIANGFATVTNWEATENPNYQTTPGAEQFLYFPKEEIKGKNTGIEPVITIKEDLFANGNDRRLLNHRTYHYLALAYAANEYLPFNATTGVGQDKMFIIGSSNIGPEGDGRPYAIMPRPLQTGQLDMVRIVPNPYYSLAGYADGDGNGFVKITNLPAKCEVDIYSLNGELVRHFSRNEQPAPPNGSGLEELQIYPDLDWDLKNHAGKTIATGIYLVRIRAEGVGEVTLKAVII